VPSLPNGARVEVIPGYVPNRQLAELFQRSTLVACPYVDATQSGVVLTAYAFRKPVVASDTGGLPEYVHHGETGLLVPPGDPGALAGAVVKLLQGVPSAASLAGRIAAGMRSDWATAAQQTLEIYAEGARHPPDKDA
jgi:glycosyltransferase involved in cell wall biosynthesis